MTEDLPNVDLDSDISGIPDIAEVAPLDDDELRSVVEALLLVVDTPVSVEALAAATQQPVYRIATKLQQMADELGAPRYEAANTLLDDRYYDNLSGQQAYKCFACRIKKA